MVITQPVRKNSDSVPSNNPRPSKRRKTISKAIDSGEDEVEELFRSTGRNGRSTKLVDMSEETIAFIEATFKSKLKNTERVECAEKNMECLNPDGRNAVKYTSNARLCYSCCWYCPSMTQ